MPVHQQVSSPFRVSVRVETRRHSARSVPSLLRIAIVAASIALSACTTVGMHTRQRVVKAPGVTTQKVSALVAAVNFAAYGIEVVVPWIRPWERSGFTFQRLFDDVNQRELEAPCDA